MPELPDVEGFKRYMSRHASGRRIRGVRVPAPAIVRNTSAQALARELKDRVLGEPSRHGKWLWVPAGDPMMVIHFGMTGGLRWTSTPSGDQRFDRLVLELEGGELAYHNMRMLGGVWMARSSRGLQRITGTLGPDAAGVDRDELEQMLGGRRGGIKAALMNQRMIAGIGNELSDEILWQARIRPTRRIARLTRRQRDELFESMHAVIADSNRHGRIPRHPRWLTSQRGVRDPTCPRCRGKVRRTKVAGRTSYWCPRCQHA
jgi:formamidopyrimidine-DNA glycosylase